MSVKSISPIIVAVTLTLTVLTLPTLAASDPTDRNRYLNVVREFADNVLKYGRDTYGPKHTPLFVDGLNIHTHEPVKWISPKGDWQTATETEEWILSNFASQQTLVRTLDGVSSITGDAKYREAATQAIRYAFEHLRAPNGLFYWGQRAAYDAQADKPYIIDHVLKVDYPYYELMWKVDPNETRRFIEAYWSAHVNDWSNLDFNRIAQFNQGLEEPWSHEYDEESPTFFKSKYGGGGFSVTATSLVHAGATLYRLSRQEQPLVWSKRLVKRFIDTRHPNTGIAADVYNNPNPSPPLGNDFKEHFVDPRAVIFPGGAYLFEEVRCMYYPEIVKAHRWISLFLVGEMLGEDGRQFAQWALEELSAWGKASYRKQDNSFVPIITDGTNIEGYVNKNSSYGPKGAIARPLFADLTFLWGYAVAYRATGDEYMWKMIRDIALGNNFGDVGETATHTPRLQTDTTSSDVYGLLGFLELYRKTKSPEFLEMAQRIGNNIVDNKFHKGFFLLSKKHIYTRFDCFEPLALLHLHAAIKSEATFVPKVWPSSPIFILSYRYKEEGVDRRIMYTLTESSEPLLSLQEAAAIGDVELVRSLLDEGVGVDSWDDSYYRTALQRAAMSGHRDVVKLLLAKGAQIDAQDAFPGGTALGYAAENGHKEIAELLIARGADINAKRRDSIGDKPLHSAVRAGHKDIAELLIANGADVNVQNNSGQTALDTAAARNRQDIVDLLLANGATVESIHVAARIGDVARAKTLLEQNSDVNAKGKDGLTPLHVAIRSKQKAVAELLISTGADVGAKDNGNYTPLFYAIWMNDANMVELLANKGADTSYTPEKGYPPLHYAVWLSNVDIARALMDHGAKCNIKDQDGWTAFRHAASGGNRDMVQLFLAKGADISGIHLAACVGDLARIKRLAEEGADVNAQDELGWTPLYWAASMGREEVGEFLLGKGARADIRTKEERTALHQAAYAGSVRLAELLISKGADVNAPERWGNIPLHSAASAGCSEVAKLLNAKGADVNARTTNGRTPLHMAAMSGHKEVVEVLVAKGADVNAKDKQGRPASDLAKQRGHTEIAELLRKHGAEE